MSLFGNQRKQEINKDFRWLTLTDVRLFVAHGSEQLNNKSRDAYSLRSCLSFIIFFSSVSKKLTREESVPYLSRTIIARRTSEEILIIYLQGLPTNQRFVWTMINKWILLAIFFCLFSVIILCERKEQKVCVCGRTTTTMKYLHSLYSNHTLHTRENDDDSIRNSLSLSRALFLWCIYE